MITGLIIVLMLTLILPFSIKAVEHNLEIFLFVMGISAAAISGVLSLGTMEEILKNHFMYMITGTVLLVSLIFRFCKKYIKSFVNWALKHMDIKVFAFLLVVILGILSSIITAIIAALILSEIINALPITRKEKVNLNVIACFSIGIGAALTPVGEPIATVIISKLNADFTFLLREIGVFAGIAMLALGFLGALSVRNKKESSALEEAAVTMELTDKSTGAKINEENDETYKEILYRTVKIFLFIIALELLGLGLKPIIDTYIIGLDSRLLYWGNMVSAFLDNATLASAEVSPVMELAKLKALLTSLLISGGILIPGNVPNIITAGKLKIKSKEWVRMGVPLGLTMLIIYYAVLFVF